MLSIPTILASATVAVGIFILLCAGLVLILSFYAWNFLLWRKRVFGQDETRLISDRARWESWQRAIGVFTAIILVVVGLSFCLRPDPEIARQKNQRVMDRLHRIDALEEKIHHFELVSRVPAYPPRTKENARQEIVRLKKQIEEVRNEPLEKP